MGTHRHRPRPRRTAALLCALATGAWWLPAAAGAAPRPTGDVVERFFADPMADPAWHARGAWDWDPSATAVVSRGPGAGEFLRAGASHFTGTIAARLRLAPAGGDPAPAARIAFAFDPASGAHRWVEVRAGSPGRLTLGQTGVVGGLAGGPIQWWRAAVPAGVWHEISVRLGANKAVTVTLDGSQLFSAAAAPLAPGLIGFGSQGAGVAFDRFTFVADPDGEPCRACHAGQAQEPLAANVFAYWDGRWWDATYAADTNVQQGGHGDPGGRPAATCTGVTGCHDLRLPSPRDHRNGVREGRPARGAQRSVNPYHLRAGFIVAEPRRPWSAQVTFDDYCHTACHAARLVPEDRHEIDTLPTDPDHHANQLGTHLTAADGESLAVFVDSDLTSRAPATEPDFVPCVACHDPHGTPTPVTSPVRSRNRMLRKRPSDPTFCSGDEGCHR